MSGTKHTPTPWIAGLGCRITSDTGSVGLTSGEASSFGALENKANTNFIVLACNHHDELVATLEAAKILLALGTLKERGLVECHPPGCWVQDVNTFDDVATAVLAKIKATQ